MSKINDKIKERAARIQAEMAERARRRKDKSAFPVQEGCKPDEN